MNTDLTIWERAAFDLLTAAAARGARCPTADDLLDAVGCESHSTTVRLVAALERKGLIRVDRHHRGRVVTIIATGQSTAPVKATTHWRERAEHLPEALNAMRARDAGLVADVLRAARRAQKSPGAFVAVLIREAMAARAIQATRVSE